MGKIISISKTIILHEESFKKGYTSTSAVFSLKCNKSAAKKEYQEKRPT
jgi:hypothetical protein